MKKPWIIFDLDGTLIDSVPDLADGVDRTLAHFGKPPAGADLVRTWVGNGSVKLVERALAWADLPLDTLNHAHEIFLEAYAECQGKTVEYEGVTEGLKRLIKNEYFPAICTNKPERFLPDILKNMGWENIFIMTVGGDTLPFKKPDPTPLIYICETFGFHMSEAIMVGDSKNDILAGKRAKMTTLALTYGYNYGQPIADSEPDAVFDDFGSLVDYIIANY